MESNSSRFQFEQSPRKNFLQLFDLAIEQGVPEANAFVLSTAANSRAKSRVVLYKGMSANSCLSFFTNYESAKVREALLSEKVSALFFWPQLMIQIRMEGFLNKLSRSESEQYFATRPRESQIGAWASLQSQEIPNYQWLEARVTKYTEEFKDKPVPCPEAWGGFELVCDYYEFWFGKMGRLHERYFYRAENPEGIRGLAENQIAWKRGMLSP